MRTSIPYCECCGQVTEELPFMTGMQYRLFMFFLYEKPWKVRTTPVRIEEMNSYFFNGTRDRHSLRVTISLLRQRLEGTNWALLSRRYKGDRKGRGYDYIEYYLTYKGKKPDLGFESKTPENSLRIAMKNSKNKGGELLG